MLQGGADIIDIGGESTRPGSVPVAAEEQLARIAEVIEYAARKARTEQTQRTIPTGGALVSVDTSDPVVARAALKLGAHIVNDVSCLADIGVAEACAEGGGALVLMHARGAQGQMPGFSELPDDAYGDVVREVAEEWLSARRRAERAGVPRDQIIFDPGLGFMKNAAHSLELLRRLDEFQSLGAPILVGASRKSFLAALSPSSPSERLGGTIAACLFAARKGASLLRVHDVYEVGQALRVSRALESHPDMERGDPCAKG